jgi:hypothetical protein
MTGSKSPYDKELSGEVPSNDDFERLIRRNLQKWLDYINSDPPLNDLQKHAEAIMADIGYSNAFKGTEGLAIELAFAVGTRFERLKLWKSWHDQLILMFNSVLESPSEEARLKFHQCLMQHHLYLGDMVRVNFLINSLLDINRLKSNATLYEVNLASVTVAILLASYEDGLSMAQEMLDIALNTGNKVLLGKTYGVLTHFYFNRWDFRNTFQYAQMVYSIGIALHNDTLIINGLHYLALSFQIAPEQAQRAFRYLDLAMQYAYWTGDALQIDYMWQTWATCALYLKEHHEAEYFFRIAVQVFNGYGDHYAAALHGHGLSLLFLDHYDEAETLLELALAKWEQLQRPLEGLYTRHALAELYSRVARHEEAIVLMQLTLADALAMGPHCSEFLINLLRTDLDEYISRRDNSA